MNGFIERLNTWGGMFVEIAPPIWAQAAILMALLLVLDLALRRRVRATIRYAVWLLFLVKLALPPSLALPTGAAYWLPAEKAGGFSALPAAEMTVKRIQPAARTVPVKAPANSAKARRAVAAPGLGWPAVLFLTWAAVAAGMGIWAAWRWRVIASIIRRSVEAPESLRVLADSCRRQVGIRRPVPVRCAAIGSPAICGFFRPAILIPPGLAEQMDLWELRSILLHELAHHKRGDLWVNLAQILLQIVHWPNPLVWLANARLRRAREQAVDEMVLVELGAEAEVYPATLLQVARLSLGRPTAALGLLGIAEPGRGLAQRILHIMNRPLPRTARIGAPGLAALTLLALVALPMACRPKSEPDSQSAANAVKSANGTIRASDILRASDNSDPGIHPGGVLHINASNGPAAQAYGILLQGVFDDMATFPEMKDGMPEGGDPKVQGLITWVQDDATNYPGKSFHQLSYIIVIGSEDPLGAGDRAKAYTLHFGNRSVLVTLLARANFSSSRSAMVVATYAGGDEPLGRRIALHWDDHQSATHAPANVWRLSRSSGPDPSRIRE